jgi:integrase
MAKTFQQRIDSATSGAVRDTETPGLYVRVGVRSRTWNYFRFGKPRRSLGRYPDVSIAEARQLVREVEGRPRTEWSVKHVLERLEARARAKGNRRPTYIRTNLLRYTPTWIELTLGDVTRHMVNAEHEKISAPVAGHFWVRSLRTLFQFAINQLDYPGRNVAAGIDTTPSKPRSRVLSTTELEEFLQRALSQEGTYWHSYFFVLAHTGARKSNLAQMKWADVDLDAGKWVIPAGEFKTKVAHTVYLSPLVVQCLRGRQLDGHNRVWPGMKNPYHVFARLRQGSYTLHDFRRSFGSRLANNGVPVQVVAKLLGHSTIATTMKHYINVSDDAARAALL